MGLLLKDIREQMTRANVWTPGNLPRNPRRYSALNVNDLEIVGVVRNNTVTIKSLVESETTSQEYLTWIQFQEMDFNPTRIGSDVLNVQTRAGLLQAVRPSVRKNPVRLKCSCQDMRFTFEKQLFDKESLIGSWRRYTRKTDWWPVRNRDNVLGYCKHVHSLLLELRKQNIITN